MDAKILKQRIIFRRLIQGVIILGIFVMAITSINHENDIFWQLKLGEIIWEKHFFPVADPFSSSAYHEVWTLHEWLPSVAFYLINQYFGPPGLIFFKATIISLTFGIFMLLFNRVKANLYLSLLVFTLAALVNTRGIWVVFPSIFEYLFLVLTLYLLEVYREKPGKLIPVTLGFLSLLWANSHGSFFLLPGVVGAYLVGDIVSSKLASVTKWYYPLGSSLDKRARFWLIFTIIASLITPAFTPNGFTTYLYPFKISFGKFTSYISEYQHFWVVWNWDFSDYVHGFAFILAFFLAFLFIANYKRLHATDLILGIFFTMFALIAVRHVAIFSLVALFLIVRYITLWFGEYRGIFRRSLTKDLVVIALALSIVYYYKTKLIPFGFNMTEDGYPKVAAELVNASNLEGNMFNHYNYGGYLIWKMPKYKVFIDGRLEMYEGKAGEDYTTIIQGDPGYQDLLEKYNINFFIISAGEKIVGLLSKDPDWKYVYNDTAYVVFVKNLPKNSEFLSRNWSSQKQETFQEEYQVALQQAEAMKFHKRGVEALAKGDLRGALLNLKAVISYDPMSVSAHLNLARVFSDFGMLDEAKKEYEFVLSNLDAANLTAKEALERINKSMLLK